jgi:hypothetical protein
MDERSAFGPRAHIDHGADYASRAVGVPPPDGRDGAHDFQYEAAELGAPTHEAER